MVALLVVVVLLSGVVDYLVAKLQCKECKECKIYVVCGTGAA